MRQVGQVGIAVLLALLGPRINAQSTRAQPRQQTLVTVRLAILAAEDRRAATPRDLAIIRSGARSADGQTARIAVRALGRLERPDLIADILPGLRNEWPEVRAEAASALTQAAQGWRHQPPSTSPYSVLETTSAALVTRLRIEADGNARSAIADAIGRLPYRSVEQTNQAERVLLEVLGRSRLAAERVGVASGLEALVRTRRTLNAPNTAAIESLRRLAVPSGPQARTDIEPASRSTTKTTAAADPARDARVRRLALEALTTAESVDDDVARRAAVDPDHQVRRLVMRALSTAPAVAPPLAVSLLRQGLSDPLPMVRLEALRSLLARGDWCAAATDAVRDPEPHIALMALDQLAGCTSAEAAASLDKAVGDWAEPGSPRTWHRPAHALVALARAAPAHAAAEFPRFAASNTWQLRAYAARAAAVLEDRRALETLARDGDDNVREAAIDGLASVAGHSADAMYVDALARGGYQVLRAAARALTGTAAAGAPAALTAALRRLVAEGHDNSLDTRTAIADTLRGLGVSPDARPSTVRPARSTAEQRGRTTDSGRPERVEGRLPPAREASAGAAMTAADLRRLASARARVTIRGVGQFDLALIGAEAPMSALRFVRLAESGYYNGLTFHRVVPNFVIQGGSPGASEYIGDAAFMRDELGQWPHVRGAVGISTRGRDTGDAQIFIDLVDNPRLDHEYTVFAQVLNGMDVVDAILEGDVIEKVEIVTGL